MTTDRIYLSDGTLYATQRGPHYAGHACPVCGEPMATDGVGSWCSDKPQHTLPVPPQCLHGVVGGAGCEDCAHDDDAELARGGAS